LKYDRRIVPESGSFAGTSADPGDVVETLLQALGRAFDLRTSTAAGELGEVLHRRLLGIDPSSPPEWGTEGSIAQVAKQEAGALDFYYRPHLFPDMRPELRLAHHLQFDLLPRELPQRCPLRVAAVLESYCHLSGDLIGWRQEDEGFFVWIADMAGHGVRAGLAAAVFHFLIPDLEAGGNLGRLAAELNDRMLSARNSADRRALYATAFLMRIDPDGYCRYTSAGHPPMILRQTERNLTSLDAVGPPIGLIPEQIYAERGLPLQREDTLFLYTDGLLEARSPAEEEFGVERIASVLSSTEGEPLDLSRAMYRQVRQYQDTGLLDDDLTFLTARLS
jgi:sigma-B regulation protein RsbU (phosphoserine phosphatase)